MPLISNVRPRNSRIPLPMRILVLWAIQFYREAISPFKGFSCAYRVHTGRRSCSNLGERAVRRYGVTGGLLLIRQRTRLCGVAHRRHALPRRGIGPFASQRGECDCDFGSCDFPSGKSFSRVFEFVNCCDCASCDWPSRKRKDRSSEKSVHIPPKRTFGR